MFAERVAHHRAHPAKSDHADFHQSLLLKDGTASPLLEPDGC
jgi:hypothetical protein